MTTSEKIHPTIYVVFLSLLLDLLAFTMILPLLPSLLDHYEKHDNTGLYTWLSKYVLVFQKLVGAPEEFNSVLFGGFLGSMFSFLQFLASPIIGCISDVVGRKKVMVVCLVCTYMLLYYYCIRYIILIDRHFIILHTLGFIWKFTYIYIGKISRRNK